MTKPKHPLQAMQVPMIGSLNYRGVAIKKLIGGWECLGKRTTDPHEVDKIIDEAAKSIDKSIKQ